MATALPLITAGITAGTAVAAHRKSKRAEKRGDQDRKTQQDERKKQADVLAKQEFEERKQLGTRRRLMSLRSRDKGGSLFGGFTGAAETLGG